MITAPSAVTPARDGRGDAIHFQALDSLRGIAALTVAIYHAHWVHGLSSVRFFQNGPLMVDFFFVLSGFVMCCSYGDRIASRADFARFLWLRLGRLYPLHFAFLLVFVAIELTRVLHHVAAHPANNLYSFATNLLLIHSLGLHAGLTFNYPSWSISVEFYTYVVFGLVVLTMVSARRIVAVAAVLTLGSIAFLVFDLRAPPEHVGYNYGLLRCFSGFFTGVIVYFTYRGLQRRQVLRRLPRWIGAGCVPAMLGLTVLFLDYKEPETMAGYLLLPIAGGLVLALVATPNVLCNSILTSRGLTALGRISYSVYMAHAAVLWCFYKAFRFQRIPITQPPGADLLVMTPPLEGTIILIAFLLALIAVSYLTFTWIEEPFRIRSKRFVQESFSRAASRGRSAPAITRP